MTSLNARLHSLTESATVQLADRVRGMIREGQRIIPLQTGEPDAQPPPVAVEAAQRALADGHYRYSLSRGLVELREAIACSLAQSRGTTYDPARDILVTNGGVHAYFCALTALLDSGDEVLVPDPAWMTHVNAVTLAGGRPVRVSADAEHDFWPTLDAWEAACSERTVALVINSPNNPTGMVAHADYLRDLYAFAQRHDLLIISDEVYDSFVFGDRAFASPLAHEAEPERVLLINSFSKRFAMTGFRVGYLAGPRAIIDQALKVVQNTITNVPVFVQQAALACLQSPELRAWEADLLATFERRRHLVTQVLADHAESSVRATPPQGAIYAFLDCRSVCERSVELAEAILEAGVAVVPAAVYGAASEGYIRVTLALADDLLQEGLVTLCRQANHLRTTHAHGRNP